MSVTAGRAKNWSGVPTVSRPRNVSVLLGGKTRGIQPHPALSRSESRQIRSSFMLGFIRIFQNEDMARVP